MFSPHQILHLLVEAGAEVEAVDKSGKSAMHHAAQGGSVYVITKYLVLIGAVSSLHRSLNNLGCVIC